MAGVVKNIAQHRAKTNPPFMPTKADGKLMPFTHAGAKRCTRTSKSHGRQAQWQGVICPDQDAGIPGRLRRRHGLRLQLASRTRQRYYHCKCCLMPAHDPSRHSVGLNLTRVFDYCLCSSNRGVDGDRAGHWHNHLLSAMPFIADRLHLDEAKL